MAEMTRDEAAALLERWAGKGLVPSDEECRKAFAVAIAALRSPGAAEMREAAIACVREQAPPRDIRTVVTEAQVSVLDRAIAAIRALPLPAPEVPEAKEAKWRAADVARIVQLEQTENRLRLCLEIATDYMKHNPMFVDMSREEITSWLHKQAAAFEAADMEREAGDD